VFDDGAWASLPGAQRARILWRVADLIEEHAGELARLETRDQGQPLSISAGFSVPMAAEVFRYYAGWCTKIESTAGPVTTPDVLRTCRHCSLLRATTRWPPPTTGRSRADVWPTRPTRKTDLE
jgi:aldehyde dehydrogenase (NAD+)/betaine-aldehyde dehydrogenase